MPHGHWKTTTFIAGLRSAGIDAPFVVDGAINGEMFLAYVEQVWSDARPGDIVVMDNLASHKGAGRARGIEAAGAAPASCRPTARLQPDREGLRQAQGAAPQAAARTIDALWSAVGTALDAFTPSECATTSPQQATSPSDRGWALAGSSPVRRRRSSPGASPLSKGDPANRRRTVKLPQIAGTALRSTQRGLNS